MTYEKGICHGVKHIGQIFGYFNFVLVFAIEKLSFFSLAFVQAMLNKYFILIEPNILSIMKQQRGNVALDNLKLKMLEVENTRFSVI